MRNQGRYRAFSVLSLGGFLLFSTASSAQYNPYYGYQRQQLEQRVDHLERSIEKLKIQVDQLSDQINRQQDDRHNPPPYEPNEWTCHMSESGAYYSATESTRGKAIAKVLKKCAKGPVSVFCKESNVICDP